MNKDNKLQKKKKEKQNNKRTDRKRSVLIYVVDYK